MRRIRGFDGLRGIAAVLVALTHYGIFMGATSPAVEMVRGAAAVQLFFVLSGFLITLLMIEEQEAFERVNIPFFYGRRALRIIPLYVVLLLFISAVKLFVYPVAGWHAMMFAWLYIYNFVPYEYYSGQLGHTWSLAVEEHFYLVWPLLFARLYPRRRPWLVSLCIAFILGAAGCHQLLMAQPVARRYFVEWWTFTAGGSIAMGCAAALSLQSGRAAGTVRRLAASGVAIALAVALWGQSLWGFAFNLPAAQLLRGSGFTLLIAWIYLNQESLLTRFLEWSALRYLGRISYGIYVYQGLFLANGPERRPGQLWPPDPRAGMLLLCLVAPLSYHAFEERLIAVGRRFRQKPVQDAVTDVPSRKPQRIRVL